MKSICGNRIRHAFVFLFLAGVLISSGSAFAALNDGMVGHYSFNACTPLDDSGTGNNGSIVGSSQCVPGVNGSALKFGGYYNRGYVTIPSTPSLSFLDNYTFTVWFNFQSNTSMDGWGRVSEYGVQTLFAKAGDRNGLDLRTFRSVDDGLLRMQAGSGHCCGGNGSGGAISAPDGVNLNEWHMATVSSGNGEVKLYLDCKLQGSLPTSEFNVNSTMQRMPLQLGIDQDAWWYPINGMLDEARVYNRPLSEAEVKELYVAGGFGHCKGENQIPAALAGPDQTVELQSCSGSTVTLDGSGSSDADNDALTYSWTWTGGSASGMNPTITLPLGTTTITLMVNDGKSDSPPATVNITVKDVTPPVTLLQSMTGIPGTNNWYTSEVVVSLLATDMCSGVREIDYSVDGISGATPGSTAAFTVGSDGSHAVTYAAKDDAGNAETSHALSINIDKTAPITLAALAGTMGSCYGSDVGVTLSSSDNLAGVSGTQYRLNNGSWQAYTGMFTITAEGVYALGYKSADRAGNEETEKVIGFSIDKTAPEAVIRFDAATKEIRVYNSETGAAASYTVLPSTHDKEEREDDDGVEERKEHRDNDGDNDGKDDERRKELRQYTLQDCANNTLVLTLLHKKHGHEIKVLVVSMQYNNGQVFEAVKNKIQAEFSGQRDGAIKELEQKVKVADQFDVEARYSARKNETILKRKVPGQHEKKETRPGMALLELLTDKGGLNYR